MDRLQQGFWNNWNQTYRERAKLDPATEYRASAVLAVASTLGLPAQAEILEIGCGTGWMCARLATMGRVTGIDIADEIISRASQTYPQVRFLAGDFLQHEMGQQFDLIVSMEVLSHVADHDAFVARIATLLKPGGALLLTSQNRFVWERRSDVSPVMPGQLRKWFSRQELKCLIASHLDIESMTTLLPAGHLGVLRLANSPKLNWLCAGLLGEERLRGIKEKAGLGQATFVCARKTAETRSSHAR